MKENGGPLAITVVQRGKRPTCCLYEAWVGVVRDEGNRQLSEVQLEGAGDDVDVLVSVRRNVRLFPICGWEIAQFH